MNKPYSKFAILAILSLFFFGFFVYGPGIGQPRADKATAALTDLQSIEELRTLFNQDQGEPRLVLVLSPT